MIITWISLGRHRTHTITTRTYLIYKYKSKVYIKQVHNAQGQMTNHTCYLRTGHYKMTRNPRMGHQSCYETFWWQFASHFWCDTNRKVDAWHKKCLMSQIITDRTFWMRFQCGIGHQVWHVNVVSDMKLDPNIIDET